MPCKHKLTWSTLRKYWHPLHKYITVRCLLLGAGWQCVAFRGLVYFSNADSLLWGLFLSEAKVPFYTFFWVSIWCQHIKLFGIRMCTLVGAGTQNDPTELLKSQTWYYYVCLDIFRSGYHFYFFCLIVGHQHFISFIWYSDCSSSRKKKSILRVERQEQSNV